MSNPESIKAAYTKPTLIEYGSLTERTQILRNQDPDEDQPEAAASIVAALVNLFG